MVRDARIEEYLQPTCIPSVCGSAERPDSMASSVAGIREDLPQEGSRERQCSGRGESVKTQSRRDQALCPVGLSLMEGTNRDCVDHCDDPDDVLPELQEHWDTL